MYIYTHTYIQGYNVLAGGVLTNKYYAEGEAPPAVDDPQQSRAQVCCSVWQCVVVYCSVSAVQSTIPSNPVASYVAVCLSSKASERQAHSQNPCGTAIYFNTC